VATIALVGTPNVGKSTLFNVLTGLQQRVGNFPGVTVEPLVGTVKHGNDQSTIIDLPGMYGMEPTSEDEALTARVLQGDHPTITKPDAVLFVCNATTMQRCLTLYRIVAECGIPTVVVVTMVDVVKADGGVFDDISLSHILGVDVCSVVGRKGIGVGEVFQAIGNVKAWRVPKHMDGHATLEQRICWAQEISETVVRLGNTSATTTTIDTVVLHPVWGSILFVLIMMFFFQCIFSWSSPFMDGIEQGVSWLQSLVIHNVQTPWLQSFLQKGLIGGVGSVIVFLPQILVLNALVTVLEECGYLARAAFLVDRVMGLFGLQGRSFIPLLGSFACAIPGIMSARIIPNYRDRMATIMATPLMTCSARLPVYTLLIASVIPTTTVFGVFSYQWLTMVLLYGAGTVSGLGVALLLKRTLFRGAITPFLMEFPRYQLPSLKSVWVTSVSRSADFLKTAGTVIVGFSIALWLLTEFPRVADVPGEPTLHHGQHQLEQSYAATIGKSIQPFFAPLGFDWQTTVGVVSSYAARETFISSMGQLYAVDVAASQNSLRDVVKQRMPMPQALALLAFYVFALQCVSTMAIMKRETGSWKWPAIAFVVTFALAYGTGAAVFAVANALQ
jgi:ferrous iron transport protein B